MALLRNSTFAGSTRTEASGSRLCETSQSTALPAPLVITRTTGPITQTPTMAMPPPRMPAVKLSTSISKPGRTRSLISPSMSLSRYAASGPIIMAPRNIGTVEPTTMPIVATAPTTAPRCPCTSRPPVYPISTGSRIVMIGPTSLARSALGIQPVGMNRAVIRPQAMKAPMLGMTMPARYPPSRWMLALTPVPVTVGV